MEKASHILLMACLVGMMILSGVACSSVVVSSSPSRAKVFINGKDTGKLTPAAMRVCSLPRGYVDFEARMPGYRPASGTTRVRVSPGKIFWSIWPPVLIDSACDGWKSARPGRVMLNLMPLPAPLPATQSTADKLKEIEKMKIEGLLTEEEYLKKRQALIESF